MSSTRVRGKTQRVPRLFSRPGFPERSALRRGCIPLARTLHAFSRTIAPCLPDARSYEGLRGPAGSGTMLFAQKCPTFRARFRHFRVASLDSLTESNEQRGDKKRVFEFRAEIPEIDLESFISGASRWSIPRMEAGGWGWGSTAVSRWGINLAGSAGCRLSRDSLGTLGVGNFFSHLHGRPGGLKVPQREGQVQGELRKRKQRRRAPGVLRGTGTDRAAGANRAIPR